MATCKMCNKKYHACSNCGLQDWEYTYCSEDCWNKDPENVKSLEILNNLISSLTLDQTQRLSYFLMMGDLWFGKLERGLLDKLKVDKV
jgi:hypothetical protein